MNRKYLPNDDEYKITVEPADGQRRDDPKKDGADHNKDGPRGP